MREPAKPQELRCAIYTRNPPKEGLEQDFNLLHAQRGKEEEGGGGKVRGGGGGGVGEGLGVSVVGEMRRSPDRQRVATPLKLLRLQARKLKEALEIASGLCAQFDAFASRRETALKLIKQVVVSDFQLVIEVGLQALMSDDARSPSNGNPPSHHTDPPGSAERRRNRDCKRFGSQRQGRSCARQSAGARLCLV